MISTINWRIILIFLVLISTNIFAQITAKVVGIKDGDTVVILEKNNTQKTLRLAEVDCPESKQPFGKNAKQFTSSKIFGKQIIYQPIQKDRYGRTIAKVYFDNGKYLSEELIKNGLGWWYSKYSKNKNLGNFQSLAKTKKLGLWSDKNSIAPWEWRRKKT
jgi:endonuclease YncB( thermonuclease family)